MEFYNAASRLYVLHFIEVAEMGNHRVLYFMLNLADGKRGGAADKEVGRMIVAVITQYLEEHPDDLVCYCHSDNEMTHAINRIFHLWARSNQDVIDGKVTFFDGADIAQLKTYILENSDAFATCIREQIELLIDIKEQMHESDHAVC